VLTPKQLKRAIRLYDRYETESREYREIAESVGWQITDLNRHIWHIKHAERQTETKGKS